MVDDEYMEVITDTSDQLAANVITVRRGVNGSTAATHLNGATVSIWRQPEDLRRAVARQAAMLHARRGSYTTMEVTALGAEMRYPADLLSEFKAELQAITWQLT